MKAAIRDRVKEFRRGTRSRPEGDSRSDANKVRQQRADRVTPTGPEAPLNAPRRGGPEQDAQIDLRPPVDPTDAGLHGIRKWAQSQTSARAHGP